MRIGDRVLFGTGIHVEPDITIGDDCVVASGVTLTQSVPPRVIGEVARARRSCGPAETALAATQGPGRLPITPA